MLDDVSLNRRLFLQGLAGFSALSMAGFPGLAFAQARTNKRLAVIILRGGMDGLAAVAPIGDADYTALRGALALPGDAVLSLDSMFALHRALEPLHGLYQKGEMAVVHAVASPYRERSHFDAQNVLELGSDKPHSLDNGWLNRLAGAINANDPKLGMAIGQTLPLMLRGPQNVGSWAPSVMPEMTGDYYDFLSKIYARDAVFSRALKEGLAVQDMGAALFHDQSEGQGRQAMRQSRGGQAFAAMAKAAGTWLGAPDGPRLATLELGGWDTHVGQGVEGGRLATSLTQFANGVQAMKEQLGPSVWADTVVVAMTEFGRTARPNGNNGTDHGTGGVMFVMGGAVRGGRVLGQWPGLSESRLYQNRDLQPTTDLRAVMKGILAQHYGLSHGVLSSDIYPGSASVSPLNGLIRV